MNSPPDTAPKKRVFKVAKIETPAAPVAPAKMSVSRAEAVKQIKAYKEKETKVSSMAAKVKERKAMRLLKALVVARRAKKAAAASTALEKVKESLKKASTRVFQKDSGGEDSERSYSIVFDKPEGLSAAEVNAAMFKLINEHHEFVEEKDGQWEFEFMADIKDANRYIKEYVNRPVAAKKNKKTEPKFGKYLRDIEDTGEYQDYVNNDDNEMLYRTSFVIDTLKDIHKGVKLSDLGFDDLDEAKAFKADWYDRGWVMMEGGTDKSSDK
jgi:hypothetical protein